MPSAPNFETFFQRTQALFLVLEKNGCIVWLNDSWERVLGWTPEEMIGKRCKEYIHPDDASDVMRKLGELAREGDTITFESRHQRIDGSWRWLLWDAQREGATGRIYASARDVTAIQTANRILEGRQRLLTMIERIAKIGYWRYDLADQSLTWSDEMFRIHGLPIADEGPTMEQVMEMYRPGDQELFGCSIETLVTRGTPFHFEFEILRPDGTPNHVRMRGQLERDIDGIPLAICGITQDISSERELRQRTIQLERLDSLGTLAAGIAHEINNPLAYIDGNLELLHEMLEQHPMLMKPSGDVEEILKDVRDGFDRIGRIVQGLRSFARADQLNAAFEIIPIEQIVQDAITLTGHELRRNANLKLEPVDTNLKVSGNSTQLTQVLVNLLLNATQAFRGSNRLSNTITLRVQSNARRIEIDITDNGKGIADEMLEQVFSPYTTTKKQEGGLGLGLSLSRQIITAHEGTLEVIETSSKGTTMRITLPRQLEVSPGRSGGDDVSRVLIIEDALALGSTFGRLLGEKYETSFCTNASCALDKFASGERFDHILCELDMTDMRGEKFWEASKVHEQHERIIFLAGSIDTELRAFLDKTNARVLLKPFKGEMLREAIERSPATLTEAPSTPAR